MNLLIYEKDVICEFIIKFLSKAHLMIFYRGNVSETYYVVYNIQYKCLAIYPNTTHIVNTRSFPMSDTPSRRSFLTAGMALGATSIATGLSAETAPPADDRKLKIGVIGLGSMSFMPWSWSDIIEGT